MWRWWWDFLALFRTRDRALADLAWSITRLSAKARRLHAALPSYVYTYEYRENMMAADLTPMNTELDQIGAVLDAALAFVNGVPARTQTAVDAALAGSASPEDLAVLKARLDAAAGKANDVAAAMTRLPAPAAA